VGIARSTVDEYLERAEVAGLTWAIAKELSDADVERPLFRCVGRNEPLARVPIDFNWVHMELRRPGVTRQLLWTECQQAVAEGPSGWRPYQYSQFCDLYEAHRCKRGGCAAGTASGAGCLVACASVASRLPSPPLSRRQADGPGVAPCPVLPSAPDDHLRPGLNGRGVRAIMMRETRDHDP
jgi:hypothetical protein